MSLLLQTLATSDSRHNTRAASQTAMTVLDVLVFDIKNIIIEAFKRDVVKQLLFVNQERLSEVLGITQEQVMTLVPRLTLGDSERRVWSNDISAVSSAYTSGVVKESQLPGIYRQLGLEQATPEEHQLAIDAKKAEINKLTATTTGGADQLTKEKRAKLEADTEVSRAKAEQLKLETKLETQLKPVLETKGIVSA
jgi:hypothetical protein